MGRFAETPRYIYLFSLSRSTLDAKGETAGRSAVDLQIVDIGMSEQFLDSGLELPIRHVFLV